jgi:sialate O-acetylesterase
MFTLPPTAKAVPKTDCVGKWEVCTPQTVGHFSAVAYYFGRHLLQNVKAPIGLIHSSWGGTEIELWIPPDVLSKFPAYAKLFSDWDATKANFPKAKAIYDEAIAAWPAAVEKAKADGKPAPPRPRQPRGGDDFGSPGCLFNGMIAPLLPYTIRGVIWYQGEANTHNFTQYESLFPLMIESWRQRWGLDEFPFLFVQLANFMQRFDEPTDSNWAGLRQAQLDTLELPHTGMAVAIDIGDANTVHPKNKQEVGRRLGLIAQATVYYQDTEYSGPTPGGAQEEEGRIRLTFRFAEGMKTSDGGKVKGFAIAGDDRKFVWADAEIQGDHVLVSSPKVPKPVAVRYGWADNPECNLVNEANLPAAPFRTDDWPQMPRENR